MIAVERRDRLGNQMFQFAFGLAASRRLWTGFVMADDLLRAYFSLGSHTRVMGRGLRALRYRVRRRFAPYLSVSVGNDDYDDPERVLDTLTDHTIPRVFPVRAVLHERGRRCPHRIHCTIGGTRSIPIKVPGSLGEAVHLLPRPQDRLCEISRLRRPSRLLLPRVSTAP